MPEAIKPLKYLQRSRQNWFKERAACTEIRLLTSHTSNQGDIINRCAGFCCVGPRINAPQCVDRTQAISSKYKYWTSHTWRLLHEDLPSSAASSIGLGLLWTGSSLRVLCLTTKRYQRCTEVQPLSPARLSSLIGWMIVLWNGKRATEFNETRFRVQLFVTCQAGFRRGVGSMYTANTMSCRTLIEMDLSKQRANQSGLEVLRFAPFAAPAIRTVILIWGVPTGSVDLDYSLAFTVEAASVCR